MFLIRSVLQIDVDGNNTPCLVLFIFIIYCCRPVFLIRNCICVLSPEKKETAEINRLNNLAASKFRLPFVTKSYVFRNYVKHSDNKNQFPN